MSARRLPSNEGLEKLSKHPCTYFCNLVSYVDPKETDSSDAIKEMHLRVDDFAVLDCPWVRGSQAIAHFTPTNHPDSHS